MSQPTALGLVIGLFCWINKMHTKKEVATSPPDTFAGILATTCFMVGIFIVIAGIFL